ncbi:BTAD domain-containing putative transcriptional regulator [Micromonospora parva]|uniref:BTAD domain-containing putative transcriptional regulator n=1 Tax=Micromonospora parva TaxID=1464048 RepID=UPI0036707842
MRARVASAAHASAVTLLVLAVPVTLVRVGRWPRPEGSWMALLRGWVEEPLSGGFLAGVAYVTAWLLWGLLAAAITARLYAQAARVSRRLPRLHAPGPLQGLTAAVLGATAVSTAAAASPAHASVTTAAATEAARPAAPQGPAATAPTAADAHAASPSTAGDRAKGTYTVRRGDTLSSIAQDCLGDADRWPEIFTANRGTRFPHVGGALRDPDLIYPGWTLRLPTTVDAPHQEARPSPRPAPAPEPTAKAPSEPPSNPSGMNPDDGVAQATAPPATTPGDQRATPGPATAPRPHTVDEHPTPTPRPRPGVSLGTGSWLDMGLVAAVLAAVALVWAHRRRRYTPRQPTPRLRLDDPSGEPMPAVVTRIRRGLRRAVTPSPQTSPDPGPPLDELVVDPDPDQTGTGINEPSTNPTDVSQPAVPALASPVIEAWPPAGLGLIGPGAEAAARGLLVSALAAGGLDNPNSRSHVVIASGTLTTLLGDAALTVADTPRLTLTSGLTNALTLLEQQTLHRTRMCADYEVDTIADLRDQDPMAEPMPPTVLIADTTAAHERARIAALLTQGQRLDIHGVLLGAWPDGDTVLVAEDGSTTPADDANEHGRHRADVGRLTVINPTETTDLLQVLAESHTGEPPPPASPRQRTPPPAAVKHPDGSRSATPQSDKKATPLLGTHPADVDRRSVLTPPETTHLLATQPGERRAPPRTANPRPVTGQEPQPAAASVIVTGGAQHAARSDRDGPAPVDEDSAVARTSDPRDHASEEPHPAGDEQGTPSGGRVGVRVLGGARIIGMDTTMPLRAKALELLVYLIVHNGDATQEQILDDLLPDAPAAKAPHRLHTYVSALRKALAHTGGPANYLTHPPHRYTLNRAALDTDLWRMRDALRNAERATTHADRTAALQRAVDAYDGALADGYGYEWIEAHREGIRRQALDAHLALAAATADPTRALAVLEAAIRHDPYAEVLYQQAMRARAALGHLDEIRALRRTLTRRLEEIDADPSGDTLELADRLIAGLRQQRPDRKPNPRDGGQRP